MEHFISGSGVISLAPKSKLFLVLCWLLSNHFKSPHVSSMTFSHIYPGVLAVNSLWSVTQPDTRFTAGGRLPLHYKMEWLSPDQSHNLGDIKWFPWVDKGITKSYSIPNARNFASSKIYILTCYSTTGSLTALLQKSSTLLCSCHWLLAVGHRAKH